MKNVFLTIVLFSFTTAFAQQAPTDCCKNQEGKALQEKCPVMEKLDLSADQISKMKELKKEISHKDSILFSEFCKKKEQIKMENLKAMKSILNKEQLEKLEKLQSEKKEFKDQAKHQGMMKQCNCKECQGKCKDCQGKCKMQGKEGSKEQCKATCKMEQAKAECKAKSAESAKSAVEIKK